MERDSLWTMCLLLFAEGGTLAFLTTPTLLYYSRFHAPWTIALAGGVASALGSALQVLVLRWLLSASHAWARRLTPSREKLEAALHRYPSATFLALVLARATPLPDAPLKLVAAVVSYPSLLYALAVFLGALPYYYALAKIGSVVKVPNWILVAAVVVIGLGVLIDRLRRRREPAA